MIVYLMAKKVNNRCLMSEQSNGFKGLLIKYESVRLNFFKWRFDLSTSNKYVLALAFACLTGIMAQLRFYLPYTPVPVTGQVFAVLLSGVILGKWYGGMSQGFYAILGIAGIPWFSEGKAGMAILLGVTGGYIVGFIFASLIIGWFTDKYLRYRSLAGLFSVMVLGIVIIYVFGVVQLALVLGVNAQKAIELGALPFVGVDIYKALIVSAIATAIVPKEPFGDELGCK